MRILLAVLLGAGLLALVAEERAGLQLATLVMLLTFLLVRLAGTTRARLREA